MGIPELLTGIRRCRAERAGLELRAGQAAFFREIKVWHAAAVSPLQEAKKERHASGVFAISYVLSQ